VRRHALLALLVWSLCAPAFAQAPVSYRLSFPEPEHHWMQVEAIFSEVPPGPLQVVMSRTSPGRYAVHEFAKNVYDVRVDDNAGRALPVARPNPAQWDVSDHSGTIRVRYRVFGDQVDGTFLGIDSTHAHINMPASLMWARGLEGRPARVTFSLPQGRSWKIATQLFRTDVANTFSAPNLHYLVDSPTELSDHVTRELGPFRIALHHDGSEEDASRFAADVLRIANETTAVFGELPAFENEYTFIADVLPYVTFDGMEHRNSTVLTLPGALRIPAHRDEIIRSAAHEFFHSWNAERIRPRSLEPFKLDAPNPSDELWFVEGFTSYYDALIPHRAGLTTMAQTAASFGRWLDTVIRSPARKYRSAMWRDFGRPSGAPPGTVARPYAMEDLRNTLASVSGDRAFADEFFDRYIEGHDVPDYEGLLSRAGFRLQKRHPGRGWVGPVRLTAAGGLSQVAAPTIEGTPIYAAGVDRGDELISMDGRDL
jgi:predicted metalloprotease with PDZ domain